MIRMLYFCREPFPTHRVDIEVLFGRELAGRGHAIDFVMQAADVSVPTGEVRWHGRTVYVGPTEASRSFLGHLRLHWRSLRHDLGALRRARKPRYDAIQVRDKFLVGAIAAWVARARGMRFYFWLSFPFPESERLRARERSARYPALTSLRGRAMDALLYRLILPRADHVFVQSERMRASVAARGIDAAKLTPVPMGVDDDVLVEPAVTPRDLERQAPRLVYLGTLAASRRLEMLIDMLAELRERGSGATLTLIGGGSVPGEKARLVERAAQLGLTDRVTFTGMLERGRALEIARTADIALSPIRRTPILDVGSPTKLFEYMALGLPVVANSHPEQADVLAESRAGVCTPWGARHFARAVAWLVRRTPEERAAMGRRGREWVREHRAYPRIADGLEDAYLADLERHCDGRRKLATG